MVLGLRVTSYTPSPPKEAQRQQGWEGTPYAPLKQHLKTTPKVQLELPPPLPQTLSPKEHCYGGDVKKGVLNPIPTPLPPQASPSGHCRSSGLAKGRSPQPLLLLQPYSARPRQGASFPRGGGGEGGCSPKTPSRSVPPGAPRPVLPLTPPFPSSKGNAGRRGA